MANILKNVVILGAGGNIGKIILDSLVASNKFTITVISRNESKAVFPAGVKVFTTDFSDTSLRTAFQGQDAVISAVGATGFNEQKALVDAAIHAGVKRFIPSEFSVNSQNEAVRQLLPLFEQKNDILKYLKSKESSGLTWTGIATSALFDWGLRNGFLEFDLSNRTATIWDSGNKRFTMTNADQLGQSVVSVLENPQETENQYLFVASVETSQREIVAALEKVTKTTWKIRETTTDEQISAGVQKLTAGDFSGAFTLVRATCFGNTPGLRANYLQDEKLANELLGLAMESVENTIRRL
ncbi:uncharacterized protein N7511_009938 [Penicillium nucicola]|uniref:uncharacterized protein n=1 Tax=Penicillium nucicola TaxID=1850975 RepID=UPI0025459062|nr:uncharacterized protein N7511_009938 [Penicillium nucicola]KAJ5748242.1 hypothetical protein N7511_009938 [Penicillium nucicola]